MREYRNKLAANNPPPPPQAAIDESSGSAPLRNVFGAGYNRAQRAMNRRVKNIQDVFFAPAARRQRGSADVEDEWNTYLELDPFDVAEWGRSWGECSESERGGTADGGGIRLSNMNEGPIWFEIL